MAHSPPSRPALISAYRISALLRDVIVLSPICQQEPGVEPPPPHTHTHTHSLTSVMPLPRVTWKYCTVLFFSIGGQRRGWRRQNICLGGGLTGGLQWYEVTNSSWEICAVPSLFASVGERMGRRAGEEWQPTSHCGIPKRKVTGKLIHNNKQACLTQPLAASSLGNQSVISPTANCSGLTEPPDVGLLVKSPMHKYAHMHADQPELFLALLPN